MSDGTNYIVVVSDHARGTDIYCSAMKDKINISGKEYWSIKGLCELIK